MLGLKRLALAAGPAGARMMTPLFDDGAIVRASATVLRARGPQRQRAVATHGSREPGEGFVNGAGHLSQRTLGLRSYETAWTWLHKLRRAMVRPDRDQLDGEVEVDETLVGGRERGKRTAGRGTTNKAAVVIAVELLEPKGLGRVRLANLRQVTSESLCGFVGATVAAGSTVRTDGWDVYAPLAERFGHQSIAINRTGHPAHVVLPGVHRVASLLKRWLTGTLHHGYSVDQLDYYLDELTFRFNRCTANSRGLLFYRLLQQAVVTDPHPNNELTTDTSLDPYIWAWVPGRAGLVGPVQVAWPT